MAIQCLVEHLVFWNHEGLLHEILAKQSVYLGNALFECLRYKRYNILEILYKYMSTVPPMDFYLQVAREGHLRAWNFLKRFE